MFSRHIKLLRTEPRAVAFGAFSAFLSSPGQTFFIALFVAPIGASLGYSAAEMGAIYLAATLSSASLLPFVGHWIDRLDLRVYVSLAVAGLALACFSASIAINAAMLFVAFLLLRMCGQGLMTHIETTSVARYFTLDRGLALSVTSLGFPVAIAATPVVAAFLIHGFGWRLSYAIVGVFLLVAALPVLVWLIAGHRRFFMPAERPAGTLAPRALDGMRAVTKTRFFWLAVPILLFMPFTSTALTFHIEPVGMAKGWSRELIASGFSTMALGNFCGLFLSGFVIDRLTARRMLPVINLPFFCGIAVLGLYSGPAALFVFFALMGISSGLVQTTFGSVWAEVYGVARLGTVRSFAAMLMVAGTAAGPAVLGLFLDAGVPIGTISLGLILAGLAATLMSLFALTGRMPVQIEASPR
ncbi:MFS transporter [Afifella sp. IM 167]|uniref:MFS transporter n=1 Tax=Afifella sp. IM 167 TaxID=2033586 RepID=UPI001CCF2ED1|nr:MFS transporter [Afifella sp. IM 167]MBZ8133043.1 hypothetical protein [Afifella sp. IM 167]